MNSVRSFLFFALTSAALALGTVRVSANPTDAHQFTLSDQDAREHVIRYPRDRTTVFVVADQKGAGQIESWIAPLFARYQRRIEIFGVADLPGIPPAFRGLFRREFKKRLTYPVMLDWNGEVARAFGYEKQQAHLFVVTTDGRIILSKTGPASALALADVYQAVDGLERTALK